MGAGDQEGRTEGRLTNGLTRTCRASNADARASTRQRSARSRKVVLAYSGGLDTSVILKWLQDTYGCEVVTFTADIGQGEEVEPARAKALQLGIAKQNIYIEDLREEFVRDFVFPMFRANAIYEGEYLLGTSIARPLIAKRLVEIAQADRRRRDRRTAPPARATTRCASSSARMRSRPTSASSRRGANGICCRATSCSRTPTRTASRSISRSAGSGGAPYSMDANLLHISYEGGVLEDPGRRARGLDVADDGVAGAGAGDSRRVVELDVSRAATSSRSTARQCRRRRC